jgi:glycosyltransferase involved in cell wall biosynthesis
VLVVVTPVQAPALLVLRAALGRSVHVLALCHNVLPHERRPVDQVLVRVLLRRVSRVLVHSEQERSRATALTPAPVTVASMPPHGVARRPPDALERDPDRPPLRVLLFFGLVRHYKGLDVLLRALAAGPPDVSLVVAGEFWGGVEETRALVDQLGLRSRVDLRPGYVEAEDVPRLLAECDALVLPYRASTSSQNAVLAHRAGVPVVATRVGTMAAHVSDGVDGLLCEPEDVAGLSRALHQLYDDGVLPRLRRGIAVTDDEAEWDRYVDAVVRTAGTCTSERTGS